MGELKAIMGLEVHLQLDTETKLFCGCSTKYSDDPNTNTCEQCLGMPGSRPVVNKKALDYGIKLALALNCKLKDRFFFSRKTYFYPDLAKNFQITQFEIPVGVEGYIELASGKRITIERVHLEEDPAALVHPQGVGKSHFALVDYNRSGIPLVEIVTAPEFESPQEAREFLNKLETLVSYLDIHKSGEHEFKVDSNVSLKGHERVEIKNITGFRNVERGLTFEIQRHRELLEGNEEVTRETRSFDEEKGITTLLRKKETEEDYGYIFEPDLTVMEVSEEWKNQVAEHLPELPEEKKERLVKEFKIGKKEAAVITSDKALAELYEGVANKVDPVLAAAFLTRELLSILNYDNLKLQDTNVDVENTIELMKLLMEGKITEKSAKDAMIAYVQGKQKPKEYIEKSDLLKDLGEDKLDGIIDEIMKKNPKAVEDFKAGNEKSLHFLVGMVMRESKGKADPRDVEKRISDELKG